MCTPRVHAQALCSFPEPKLRTRCAAAAPKTAAACGACDRRCTVFAGGSSLMWRWPEMGEAVMTTRRQADGAIVIDIRGSLDAATVDALREALTTTLQRERPVTMIVDLTYVTFMDSLGIGTLVAGHGSAREVGTRFVLRNPSEFVHRQLRVT